jgi:hypothetical protein
MCPQIADAPAGKPAAGKSSCKQAETQVRPDGFHFEQSVYYHIYALDFFRFARTWLPGTRSHPTLI